MAFDHGRRSLLTRRDLGRFPSETLFDRVARVLCEAECVPRKELFETWEVARRVRRRVRGCRVVDVACGHGLLAHLMLLLDDTSSHAIALDPTLPPSAETIARALTDAWPRLVGRVSLRDEPIERFTVERGALVVSAHACGALTDRVLDAAIAVDAHVAVLPCCHAYDGANDGGLRGWMEGALAIDAVRAGRLRGAGYGVFTQTIPEAITPKNRLLIGVWAEVPSPQGPGKVLQ